MPKDERKVVESTDSTTFFVKDLAFSLVLCYTISRQPRKGQRTEYYAPIVKWI